MSYHRKKETAASNIRQVKGFECPTCESYVPRGYEVCYNCGDMPVTGSGSGYSSNYSDGSGDVHSSCFFFLFTFIAPILYMFSAILEDPRDNVLNIFIFIPNMIIVLSSAISLVRNKIFIGCLATPVRLWVLTFGVLTLINTIKTINYQFF